MGKDPYKLRSFASGRCSAQSVTIKGTGRSPIAAANVPVVTLVLRSAWAAQTQLRTARESAMRKSNTRYSLFPVPATLHLPIARALGMMIGFAVVSCLSATSMLAQDEPDSLDKLTEKPAMTKDDSKINLGEVRKILRQLESDKAADRDAAEKRLIEVGPSIVAFLPEVNSSTSGEMKIRLERIRKELQTSKIETFFDASLVTLNGKMPLSEALAALTKQTGNKVGFERTEATPTKEVEVKADKQPFWEVLDDLMIQSHLRLNTYANNEGIVLMPDDSVLPGPEPFFSGPFQVSAISTQTTKQFYGRTDGQLDISLQVAWEPRLKPIFIQLPTDTMKLSIAGSEELSTTNPGANLDIPVSSEGAAAQIDLQFPRPPRTVGKIDKLKGEFVMAVPSEKHKYLFEKFGNGKRQSEKFGEVTVTMESARRNGSAFEIRILAEFKESQGALDSFRGWILSNRAYLVDSKQNRLENASMNTYAISGDSVGVAFLFLLTAEPDDYTLIYESPAMITRQNVKFELTDIDLP